MNFSPRALITRLFGRRPDLAIPTQLWSDLLDGLRARGRGERESGAFLLGRADDTRCTKLRCSPRLIAVVAAF